jgi:hypothetical protein
MRRMKDTPASTDEPGRGADAGRDTASTPNGSEPSAGDTIVLPENLSLAPQDLTGDRLLSDIPRLTLSGDKPPVPALGGIPLLSKLGQGGMGAVYYGVHPRLQVEVAIKILPFHLAEQQPGMVERFLREARVAARVKSPHLAGVLDVNEEKGLYYIVMEFVQGESAGDHLRSLKEKGETGLPESTALDICIAAAKGIAAAHEKGVIHRDLKPDNILIPKSGGALLYDEAKVADLGLARSDKHDKSLTGYNQAMGTPGYMAPEQGMDAKTAGKPADVFSIGATLYALLSGKAPFAASSVMKSLVLTLQETHPPLRPIRPDLAEATTRLVDRCLDKEPAKRPSDARALLEELKACRAGQARSAAAQPGVEVAPEVPTLPDTPAPLEPTVVGPRTAEPAKAARSPEADGLAPTLIAAPGAAAPAVAEKGKTRAADKRRGRIAVAILILVIVVIGIARASKSKKPVNEIKKTAETTGAEERAGTPDEKGGDADQKTDAEPAGDEKQPVPDPKTLAPPDGQKPDDVLKRPADFRRELIEKARKGNVLAGARMLDLLMFSEIGSFTPQEIRKLGIWSLGRRKVGEKHPAQIHAVFRAHAVMRQKRPAFKRLAMNKARKDLERFPLKDPVLLSQAAWLEREAMNKDKAQEYVRRALRAIEEEDQSTYPDLFKAARARLKAELNRPDRNKDGSRDQAVKAYEEAAGLFKKAGDDKAAKACLQERDHCRDEIDSPESWDRKPRHRLRPRR